MPAVCDDTWPNEKQNKENRDTLNTNGLINDCETNACNNNNNNKNGNETIDGDNMVNNNNNSDKNTVKNGYANGYKDEDVDDDNPNAQTTTNGTNEKCLSPSTTKSSSEIVSPSLSSENEGEKSSKVNGTSSEKDKNDQEFIFIHDTGFNVQILAPGVEPFEIQVSSMELVQEIHHLLMDREDTCHRTCFSLQLDGVTLDNFAELKSIEGLKEGSQIKVMEEPYTVREARIHVRHIRDLLKSLDSSDAYNGVECNSLSFLNIIAQGDIFEKRKGIRPESIDCTPPEFILPSSKEKSLTLLQPQPKDQKSLTALKVLTTSGWNPPPGTRKLHGDLMYLYVITLEDKRFHITASTRGFFVNQSTEEEFNPKPANPKLVYHSLVDLLSQISSSFKRNFIQIQKKRHQRHPFERVATPYQVYSWTAPHIEHTIDSIRAEDAFSSKLGYEEHIPGQTRDWNEELQTTRELSRKSLPERLLRERAIFKVHSDFVAAATRGAIAVIDGNVMAINPGEETKMQMFIWNNIFFSLGFDVKDHYKELGGDAAAFVAPNNDLQGVKAYNAVDVEGLCTLGTVVIDYRGYRVTAQSIIPGILEREQEQSVVYGSVDFGKTVVTHKKYLEYLGKAGQVLKIAPHVVINEKDEPVEICSSVECKGIIGNDGRHYILDLLRTFPPDVNFFPIEINEYSDAVRKMGFPRVHKHKLCCLRQELIDAFFESRYLMFIKVAAFHLQQISKANKDKDMKINEKEDNKEVEGEEKDVKAIEPEVLSNDNKETTVSTVGEKSETDEYKKIVESFTNGEKTTEIDSTKEVVRKAAAAVGSLKETEFDIRFNPDVYSPTVKHADSDGPLLQKERKLVRDAAEFLLTVQIPSFIKDCLENNVAPLDGITLCETLHNRGINIRYLGKIVELLSEYKQLKYLHIISMTELVCRAAKHLFTNFTQNIEMTSLASGVSHFLNCFLSSCQSISASHQSDELQIRSNKRKGKRRNRITYVVNQESNEWMNLTSKSLWSSIKSELDSFYGFKLTCDSIDSMIEQIGVNRFSMLRSFCIKTGLQLLLREYNFENRSKITFNEEDILNIFPVVKHIHPRSSDAYNFYTTGQSKIQQGFLKEGYELISEALNLLNNVYGAMHPEIAQCLRMLARLNYIMGDYTEAMSCQQKAVLMSEKVNGIDHPYTITEYMHLALYCFANSQITVSLKLLYRARYLMLVVCGENHPEMAILDSNIGLILHAVSEYDLSLRFLESALKLNIHYYGANSLKAAVSYHLVARTQSCMGDFRGALQNEKETFAIYKQHLGEDHEKTKESSECLRHLTQQAVVLQKKMNELYKGNTAAVIPPIQIQPPSMSSVLEMLNIINGILFVQIGPQDIENLKSDLFSDKKMVNGKSDEETKKPESDLKVEACD